MFVVYCTTCKIVIGWGDNAESLKTTRHSSGTYELVNVTDVGGNNVLDEHDNPVMRNTEILHECDVFEIASLPENVSSDDMRAYLEENYEEEMV